MADKKITDLNSLNPAASNDVFPVVDVSAGGGTGETMKITLANLMGSPGPIGANVASTGEFTSLTLPAGATIIEFSTDVTLGGDSDVVVPTEHAVKTYVDNQISTKDEHNELYGLQGGDATANEFYHLSQAVYNGLFAESPTIALGNSDTNFKVDYGSQEITGFLNSNKYLNIDSNTLDIGDLENVFAEVYLDWSSKWVQLYADGFEINVNKGNEEITLYAGANYEIRLQSALNATPGIEIISGTVTGTVFKADSDSSVVLGAEGVNLESLKLSQVDNNITAKISNITELLIDSSGISLKSGVPVNEISNDSYLTSDSTSSLITEHAVKTYVDNQIARTDEHNELLGLQGGDATSSEFYHLTQAVYNGLFAESPTIALGDSQTNFKVDYGSQEISGYLNSNKYLNIDSNTLDIGDLENVYAEVYLDWNSKWVQLYADGLELNVNRGSEQINLYADSGYEIRLYSAANATPGIELISGTGVGTVFKSDSDSSVVLGAEGAGLESLKISQVDNTIIAKIAGVTEVLIDSSGISLKSGVSANGISNDSYLTSDSTSSLVTEHAVKAYVDAQIARTDEHNELLGLQGGDSTADEFYHLTKAIHDGLFSASPAIGLGDSTSNYFLVDYGTQRIESKLGGTEIFTSYYGGANDYEVIIGSSDFSGDYFEFYIDNDAGDATLYTQVSNASIFATGFSIQNKAGSKTLLNTTENIQQIGYLLSGSGNFLTVEQEDLFDRAFLWNFKDATTHPSAFFKYDTDGHGWFGIYSNVADNGVRLGVRNDSDTTSVSVLEIEYDLATISVEETELFSIAPNRQRLGQTPGEGTPTYLQVDVSSGDIDGYISDTRYLQIDATSQRFGSSTLNSLYLTGTTGYLYVNANAYLYVSHPADPGTKNARFGLSSGPNITLEDVILGGAQDVDLNLGATSYLNISTSPGGTSQTFGATGTGEYIQIANVGNVVSIYAAGSLQAQFDTNGVTLNSGASVNEFSIDGTLVGNSDDAIPTEKAVKTYVDTPLIAMSEPTGFENTTDSIISFDSTGTFSIEPTGASFSIWMEGLKYTYSTKQSVTITPAEGTHFFYFDYSDQQLKTSASWPADLLTKHAYCGVIYWDADAAEHIYFGDERHGITMDGRTHINIHSARGTLWRSGTALGDITPDGDGSTDDQATFSITSGLITDEDLDHIIPASDATAVVPIFYKSGANGYWRRLAATNFPVTTTGTGRLAYNQFTGGTWQLTEVSNNAYALAHIVVTNDPDQPTVAIMGQATYTGVVNAREGATTEVNNLVLSGLGFEEFVFVGTLIYQTSDGYTNSVKSRIRTTDEGADYVDFRTFTRASTGSTNDHGNLSGLGDDDHLQYILVNGTRAFTGTVTINGDLNVSGDGAFNGIELSAGVPATEISNDEMLASDSTSALVTEHAIKAYTEAYTNENIDISDIFLSPKLDTKPLTKDVKYERNGFLFKDSTGKYWLAYVRCITLDSRTDGDVDNAYYEVYYKTSIDGIIWTIPTKFPGSFNAGFSPKQVCVVEDDTGDIHFFIGNGTTGSPNSERLLYHSKTTNSGVTWSVPVAITITGWSSDPAQVGHMHVQYANSKFYLTFQQRSNMSTYFAKSSNPELFGSYTTIHASSYGIPKIFVDGTDVYIVSVKFSGPTCNLAISNNDGASWSNTDVPFGGYDPAITRLVNGNLGFAIAPSFGADGQKLQLSESTDNGASWGSLQDLTPDGLRGTDEYWDYWPNFYQENNTDYIVYTSEDDLFGRAKQPGNVYLLKLNTYVTRDNLIENTSLVTGDSVKDALDYVAAAIGTLGGETYSGRVNIPQDATSLVVVYDVSQVDENYSIVTHIVNRIDWPPSIYAHMTTDYDKDGFTEIFSGQIDSANYVLHFILSRNELSSSSSSSRSSSSSSSSASLVGLERAIDTGEGRFTDDDQYRILE